MDRQIKINECLASQILYMESLNSYLMLAKPPVGWSSLESLAGERLYDGMEWLVWHGVVSLCGGFAAEQSLFDIMNEIGRPTHAAE